MYQIEMNEKDHWLHFWYIITVQINSTSIKHTCFFYIFMQALKILTENAILKLMIYKLYQFHYKSTQAHKGMQHFTNLCS